MAIPEKQNLVRSLQAETIQPPEPPQFKIEADRESFNRWYEQYNRFVQLKITSLDERVSKLEK